MNPGARAVALFRDAFAADPAAVATSPGRVNLIGEHVDYHGGHVLPVATAERTAVAVGPARGRLRCVSEQAAEVEVPWPHAAVRSWGDYVAGVAQVLEPDIPELRRGLSVAVASDLPMCVGLSSSAALGVATAAAVGAWAGRRFKPRELADIAFRSETGYVGIPCGMMDQLAVSHADAAGGMLIDCRTLEIRPVHVGVDLVLAESGETRALRDSDYVERRREGNEAIQRLRAELPAIHLLVDVPPARLAALAAMLPPPLDRRVRHVVSENQRTLFAARSLESGDFAALGALINASHESLRDLYECSTPRLDAIVAAAREVPRVLGARLVGAGWGGSVLVVAEPGAGGAVAAHLRGDPRLALPAVRTVAPGDGARVEP